MAWEYVEIYVNASTAYSVVGSAAIHGFSFDVALRINRYQQQWQCQCSVHTDHAVICYKLHCTVHMNIYIAFVFDVALRTYVHLRQQQCIVQTR